ncbi:MAG: NADH-quinone oxidoreductase subunit J [Prochlorotrichaceae cyanobacterium]
MNLAEGVQLVCFAILSGIVVLGALGVVLTNSIVYAAFLLGAVFIGVSGLYLLLNASFVAAAQILIYVGAVNVLILFAIMLVNKQEDFKPLPYTGIRKVATGLVCAGLFALLASTIVTTIWQFSSVTAAGDQSIYVIGKHFFSDYLLPFELASILLLMALIGAIVLARREYYLEPTASDAGEDLRLPERPRALMGDR